MSPCRIYVAGGSSESAIVADYMGSLRRAGFTVTHDWTTQVIEFQARGIRDSDMSTAQAANYARADVHGVVSASTLWLLAPAAKSEGAWFELGLAEGHGLRLIVSGPTSNIFRTRAHYLFENHADALAFLTSTTDATPTEWTTL